MIDRRQLSALNLEGVTISAQINADGTLSPVEGGFNKLLAAAKEKALPRIHTVVVHPNQKAVPPELSDSYAELRVFKAWTLEEAVQRILVDEQTRWGDIPDFREVLYRYRDFVGREWLTEQIETAIQWAVTEQGPAYILITGKPGAGKSAFVAHQISRQVGAVYHFIRRGEGNLDDPETLLNSLTAQLRRIYALPWRMEEHNLTTIDLFYRVLKQVSRKLEKEQYQTIWIDGLDEAFGPLGRFSDRSLSEFIPLNGLPKGIVLILTSRPGGEHLNWLDDPEQFFSISIDAQQKNSKEDIQAYLMRQNDSLALGLRPEFLNQLVEASEGCFVAAVRYLHPNPHLKEILAEWQLHPETIPKGLSGWLNWQWQWLLRAAKGQNIPERTLSGVLGYLAITDEKERAKILFHFLSGNQLEEYWDRVLQLSSELVERVQARGSRDIRYRFFHPHFAEFIWEKIKQQIRSISAVKEDDKPVAYVVQKDGKKAESDHSLLTVTKPTMRSLLALGIVLVLIIAFGGRLLMRAQNNSAVENPTNVATLTTLQTELATPSLVTLSPQVTHTVRPMVSSDSTEIPSTAIPDPIVIWSNYWSQGYGFDAFTTGWKGYRNLIKDVAWATEGDGEFQGERVLKISIKDDLLPENWEKYEDGSGTMDPGYFELDWRGYIQADGFSLTPHQEFSPPLTLPIVYESSFMIGDDFKRVNTNNSNPIRFDDQGELILLTLFDTIDTNGPWYLMAHLKLEGTLDRLYPVVISSGDVRGDSQRNIGDVYLSLLTPYGQQHPLKANKRYWYQVVVTSDKQIKVSFKDSKDAGYHVYLKGNLSNAINPQLAIFRGPLTLYWAGLGPEFRIISGTFIRGSERIYTWESADNMSPVSSSRETFSATESSTLSQLSTPQSNTVTSEAILLEDHFDTQRFDGSYNGLLWNCWGCSPELVFQKDGIFQIKVNSSPEAGGPNLTSVDSWNSMEIGYIEAKLKLQDYEGNRHADVHAQLWTDFQDYQWWTSCDVLIEPNSPAKGYFRCHDGRIYPDGTGTGDYVTPSIPINPDEWQLVRIEIEPETFRLNFYLNGEIIGTMIPSEADLLKSKDLTPIFGTWTEGMSIFTAYLDDLIVAPQSGR